MDSDDDYLGPNTWPIIRDLVDDVYTVSEEEILRSTKMIWEQLEVCIEPSAGVGVAVAMGDEFSTPSTLWRMVSRML
jgi:serine racemase